MLFLKLNIYTQKNLINNKHTIKISSIYLCQKRKKYLYKMFVCKYVSLDEDNIKNNFWCVYGCGIFELIKL